MKIKYSKKFLIGFFLILLLLYTFIEPHWLELKKSNIISKDLPASFENTKIVFVSDIHHGPYFSRKRVRNLVQQINNLVTTHRGNAQGDGSPVSMGIDSRF